MEVACSCIARPHIDAHNAFFLGVLDTSGQFVGTLHAGHMKVACLLDRMVLL